MLINLMFYVAFQQIHNGIDLNISQTVLPYILCLYKTLEQLKVKTKKKKNVGG